VRRKRRQRDRAIILPGAEAEMVSKLAGHARQAARKHGYSFDDENVIDAVVEAASELGIDPSDRTIESAANRLLGRERIDDRDPAWHCWHLY
jgi:hypothetical protein